MILNSPTSSQLRPSGKSRDASPLILGLALCISLACLAADKKPEDNTLALLSSVERLHGKFILFASRRQCFCAYEGLLTRDSDRSGLVKEATGFWVFRSAKRDSEFRLMLCAPEKSDCIFIVDGLHISMRIYRGGDLKLEADVVARTLGCTLGEFQEVINKSSGLEASRHLE